MITDQHDMLFYTILDYVNKHIPEVIHTYFYRSKIYASCLTNNLKYVEVYAIEISEQFLTVTSTFNATKSIYISDPHCLDELLHHLRLLLSISL